MQNLYALALFAFISSITPGPNNIMLATSGVNFGFRRTIPHMLGVGIGFTFMLMAVGFGLGALFQKFPALHLVLKILGSAYMLYLAYKIATSSGIGDVDSKPRPMTFMEASLFQWVNVKAWTMAIGAMTLYLAPHEQGTFAVIIVALVFGIINLPCVSIWAGFGVFLRRYLDNPRALRVFNFSMAGLLVLSILPMLA